VCSSDLPFAIWSCDGNYVCYHDIKGKGEKAAVATIIWDVKKAKKAATVAHSMVVGAYPQGALMLLTASVEKRTGLRARDAASGKEWLIDDSMSVITANTKYVVYSRGTDKHLQVYYGEIELPAEAMQAATEDKTPGDTTAAPAAPDQE
jgi:hypothetical protein